MLQYDAERYSCGGKALALRYEAAAIFGASAACQRVGGSAGRIECQHPSHSSASLDADVSRMMSVLLRRPIEADYEAVASWIPDSKSCARWAGPRVPFPFFAPELPTLLAVPDSESYCLSDRDSPALGFGQLWLRDGDAVRLMRIIISPAIRGQGFGRELCRQLIARAVDGNVSRRRAAYPGWSSKTSCR